MSLADLCDDRGRYRVLAVDHRDSLRLYLEPTAPETVPDALMT